ncbi:hypothetical protein BC832DRAFT_449158 [Gaertneriomyces semiglobifer]|nr:hypothetical protein BC832DRAFT_449158 [Gaertneriomyces semiglobifer]
MRPLPLLQTQDLVRSVADAASPPESVSHANFHYKPCHVTAYVDFCGRISWVKISLSRHCRLWCPHGRNRCQHLQHIPSQRKCNSSGEAEENRVGSSGCSRKGQERSQQLHSCCWPATRTTQVTHAPLHNSNSRYINKHNNARTTKAPAKAKVASSKLV